MPTNSTIKGVSTPGPTDSVPHHILPFVFDKHCVLANVNVVMILQ
jgi:hypothetical protein